MGQMQRTHCNPNHMLVYGIHFTPFFFPSHLFFCRISVLDCCTGQSPSKEIAAFIFGRSSHETMTLLDKLVYFLGDAGFQLNAEKIWPGGYVSKVYTYLTRMKLWTNMTLGLVDEALMELWYKLILSLEIHGPFSIKVGATTTSPLEMITVQCIAFWDSVSRKF